MEFEDFQEYCYNRYDLSLLG